jgi:hypothetical protein
MYKLNDLCQVGEWRWRSRDPNGHKGSSYGLAIHSISPVISDRDKVCIRARQAKLRCNLMYLLSGRKPAQRVRLVEN